MPWYNASWLYRRAITVDNTSGSATVSAFQVMISLTSSNMTFAHANSDGSDIRFTHSDEVTVIPHWLESYDSVGQTATIWIKVTGPITTGNTGTIYMYYGNVAAIITGSNGRDTFLFFDESLFGGPAFTRGAAATWDDDRVVGGGIALDTLTNIYHIYYRGDDGSGGQQTGHATSTDLIAWTKDVGNPIISPAVAWEGTALSLGGAPLTDMLGNAVTYNSKYWLLYRAGAVPQDNGIASASSLSGPWTKYASNPVFTGAGGGSGVWDSSEAKAFCMVQEGATFYIFYAGRNDLVTNDFEIGYATSTDLITWTRNPGNPVLTFGVAWENGNLVDPIIRKYGGTYYLFYTGDPTSTSQLNGYASASAIGGPYTKFASNPITPAGKSFAQVIKRGDTWYMLTDNHTIKDKTLYWTKDLAAVDWEWPAYSAGAPTVASGQITLASNQGLESTGTFLYKALRARINFVQNDADATTQNKWVGFSSGTGPPTVQLQTPRSVSTLALRVRDVGVGTNVTLEATVSNAFKIYDIVWTAGATKARVDGGAYVNNNTDVPSTAKPVNIRNAEDDANLIVDWVAIREAAVTEPSTSVASETVPAVAVAVPVGLTTHIGIGIGY